MGTWDQALLAPVRSRPARSTVVWWHLGDRSLALEPIKGLICGPISAKWFLFQSQTSRARNQDIKMPKNIKKWQRSDTATICRGVPCSPDSTSLLRLKIESFLQKDSLKHPKILPYLWKFGETSKNMTICWEWKWDERPWCRVVCRHWRGSPIRQLGLTWPHFHLQQPPTNNRNLQDETEGYRVAVVAVHWVKELIPLDLQLDPVLWWPWGVASAGICIEDRHKRNSSSLRRHPPVLFC